jgi:hypothetical protein
MTVAQAIPVLTAQQLADAFARNVRIIKRQVAGLTHADSLIQPPVRGNCLNWVLGHIAVHRDYILATLGEPKTLDEAAAERYGSGSEPVLGDGEGVLPLETLLGAIDLAQERIVATLARAGADDLAKELPTGERTITVAQQVFGLYFHETYHTGQTELLRQLAGTNDKVI